MMNRRKFNKTVLVATGVTAGASMGVLPQITFAAWPTSAFDAESIDDAVKALYGDVSPESSDAISFKAPDIAENGAVVPVSVIADIDNVDHVSLLVATNPSPLAATFEQPVPGKANVSTRIKMGKTSELIAMVRADGKVYTATSNEVKVTIGGCGG